LTPIPLTGPLSLNCTMLHSLWWVRRNLRLEARVGVRSQFLDSIKITKI